MTRPVYAKRELTLAEERKNNALIALIIVFVAVGLALAAWGGIENI